MGKGHGRLEQRTLTSTTALNDYLGWPRVGQVCEVQRRRTIRGEMTSETAYYVTSLSRARGNAEQLLALARRH